MPRSLRHLGKILASAVLFTCLGVGGVLFSLTVCPALRLMPGTPETKRRRATRLIRGSFRLFVWGLEGSGILKVLPEDLPDTTMGEGAIIIANHPSYLDIVVLLALLPNAVCVVKEAVWNNPFFGSVVRTAGFIPIRDVESVLEASIHALEQGLPLVIFPEGTRTPLGTPPHFHRGAAALALQTGKPLHPLLITVSPPLLEKGDRWYHVPVPTCRFRVCGRVPMAFESDGTPLPQRAREATQQLEAFYQRELHGLCHHTP
ncbi:lysophospholipid acyltransferase family protein [Holophaga foetida]|uniref:lysophospholipid acyltransferase family protein n=1 Tax=Holophaga foetida TaxID=35839 RepID=UPI0002471CA4|nr:lysophospholipid acyltransferase family protein [Holophaga foetida]